MASVEKEEEAEEYMVRALDLTKYFPAEKVGILERLTGKKERYVRAVDHVDIVLKKGLTTALVGESGSGKTTIGRMLATLETPTSGTIYYGNLPLNKETLSQIRRKVQIVFQNPYESLDPRMSIREIVGEPLVKMKSEEKSRRVREVLSAVGLKYEDIYYRKARDLSGGQRQRIAIARAMAASPEFIVLDEPTSALDASVQSQVLNLLVDLRGEFGYTYLFITHNMMVARYISDYIYVMYAGKIAESGPTEEVFENPLHPYTKLLLKSVPHLEPGTKLEPMSGEAPSLLNPPTGCRFHPRCPFATDKCRAEEPPLIDVQGHKVACHLYKK